MATFIDGQLLGNWFRDGNYVDKGFNAGLEIIRGFDKGYVIETGENANGYYRIWSDGWLEMWAFQPSGSNVPNPTQTYPLAMAETVTNFPKCDSLLNTSSSKYDTAIRTYNTTDTLMRQLSNSSSTMGLFWSTSGR